jgi:hypothetical protein
MSCVCEEEKKRIGLPVVQFRQARSPLAGVLLNKDNGFPVEGLTVRALLPGIADAGAPQGVTVSDENGRFVLWLLDSPESASVVLEVVTSAGTICGVTPADGPSPPGTVRTFQIVLPAVALTARHWSRLADRMEQEGITQVPELISRLARVPARHSICPEWKVEARHAAANALTEELLDPDGVLSGLDAVPSWYIAILAETYLVNSPAHSNSTAGAIDRESSVPER